MSISCYGFCIDTQLYFPYTFPIRKQVLINLTTGRKASFNLDELDDIYAEIQAVNIIMARRLLTVCQEDSLINALILLDMFAKALPPVIEDALEEIHPLFAPLLKDNP